METAAEIAASKWPALYIAIEHHRNTIDKPMTFVDAAWWIPIYQDNSNDIVLKSAVQTGKTEYLKCKSFAGCLEGWSVLYTLPGDHDAATFVSNRIKPLLERIPFYAKAVGHTDNVRIKKIWGGTIKYIGSNTIEGFKEFPAQMLVIDELDYCDQENIVFAVDRLGSAQQRTGVPPTTVRSSNPTLPNYGIDKLFNLSNKQKRLFKCLHCNTWQPLSWFDNIVIQEAERSYLLRDRDWSEGAGLDPKILCTKCGGEIDRFGYAEWVAEHPGVEMSGYEISKLFTAQTTITKLWSDPELGFNASLNNPTKYKRFITSDLGMAYSGAGERVDEQVLAACADANYHMPHEGANCIAGVDVGGVFHVHCEEIVDGKRVKRYIGHVNSWEEVGKVFEKYNVWLAVIDVRPETHAAKRFQAEWSGIVWLCEYPPNPTTKDMQVNQAEAYIKIDKHQSLDASLEDYLSKRVVLPVDWQSLDGGDFVAQMIAPVRTEVERSGGIRVAIWVEGDNPDHHRHADNYCKIASDLLDAYTPGVC